MGFEFELRYIPKEQITNADALSKTNFDENESDNDRVCFATNNLYFALRDLVTQLEINTKLEQTDSFSTWRNESKMTVGNSFQQREWDSNNRKMHWLYIMK